MLPLLLLLILWAQNNQNEQHHRIIPSLSWKLDWNMLNWNVLFHISQSILTVSWSKRERNLFNFTMLMELAFDVVTFERFSENPEIRIFAQVNSGFFGIFTFWLNIRHIHSKEEEFKKVLSSNALRKPFQLTLIHTYLNMIPW